MAGATSAEKSPAVGLDEDDEYWALSGKPYFDVLLTKSHLEFSMFMPNKMRKDLSSGPCTKPAVLTYQGKNWNMLYHQDDKRHRFRNGWKQFVIDNDLKVGDACVFELSDCSSSEVKFKVQILKGDFPEELLENEDGETPESAIFIE